MSYDIFSWLMAIIFIENFTEFIISDNITERLRFYLSTSTNQFIAGAITCGRCFSFWPSLIVAIILPGDLVIKHYESLIICDIIIKAFVLHRLSNVFHEFVSRWLNKHPFTMIFHNIDNETHTNIKTLDTNAPKSEVFDTDEST